MTAHRQQCPRRAFLLTATLATISLGTMSRQPVLAQTRFEALQAATDLAALAASSGPDGAPMPFVLLVSQSDCPYCERLKAEVLAPLVRSGQYRGRMILAELMSDEADDVVDFDGQPREAGKVAARYRAWVSPTILFLDRQGAEIRPRIVGYQTPDLFPYYLERAIEQCIEKLAARGS